MKNYIILFGGVDEFFIMENSTQVEVKNECFQRDNYGNYGRKGVTAYVLPEPFLKIDENGDTLIDNTSNKITVHDASLASFIDFLNKEGYEIAKKNPLHVAGEGYSPAEYYSNVNIESALNHFEKDLSKSQ